MKRGVVLGAIVALALGATFAHAQEAPRPDKDGWYALFNGKDLTGWKPALENEETFQVRNGEIVINSQRKYGRAHLFYAGPVQNANFKNFEFKADVKTEKNANSGIFFHTRFQEKGWPKIGYECQVNQTYPPDPQKTGGLYNTARVSKDKNPAKDGAWYTQNIIVKGKHVVVNIITDIDSDNPKVTKVVDFTEPEDKKQPCLSSGTFALQGHDPGSTVHYKNIKVKPLP